VPDTFAHDEKCFPTYLEPIQAVNLAQVKKNPRVISSSLPSMHEVALLLQNISKAGIRTRTLGKIASQLLSERFDRRRVSRRPVYQTVLFWDVISKALKASSPRPIAVFSRTTSLASCIASGRTYFQRTLAKTAPEDVGSLEPLMRFSLGILDEMLSDVLAWMEKNPALVTVFASSMGQAAIHRDEHEGIELHITNVNNLLESTGLRPGDYVPLLGMVPQVAAEIADPKLREQTRFQLLRATTIREYPLFHVDEIGTSLSITVTLPPKTDIEAGVACLGGNRMPYSSLGITPQRIASGTGYHIPAGAFALLMRENGSHPNHSRSSFARIAIAMDDESAENRSTSSRILVLITRRKSIERLSSAPIAVIPPAKRPRALKAIVVAALLLFWVCSIHPVSFFSCGDSNKPIRRRRSTSLRQRMRSWCLAVGKSSL